MNRRQQPPQRRPKNAAYRQAFERLDESLAGSTSVSNAERLQLIGKHMFGELWKEPEPSDSEGIPKRECNANAADGISIEDEKLTRARVALFGCAPK
jgi:hypothetical protein